MLVDDSQSGDGYDGIKSNPTFLKRRGGVFCLEDSMKDLFLNYINDLRNNYEIWLYRKPK